MNSFVHYISVLKELCKKYDMYFVISEFGIKMTKTWGFIGDKDSFYKCNHVLDLEYMTQFETVEEFEDYIDFMNRDFNKKYHKYLEEKVKE